MSSHRTPELGYAVVRFGAAMLLLAGIAFLDDSGMYTGVAATQTWTVAFLLYAGTMLVLAAVNPAHGNFRGRIGLGVDTLCITAGIHLAGDAATPLVAAYPLTLFAAALFLDRREQALLVGAQILGFLGLVAVQSWTQGWQTTSAVILVLLVAGALSLRLARPADREKIDARRHAGPISRPQPPPEWINSVQELLRENQGAEMHRERRANLAAMLHVLYPDAAPDESPESPTRVDIGALATSCAGFIADFRDCGTPPRVELAVPDNIAAAPLGPEAHLRRFLLRLLDPASPSIDIRLVLRPHARRADHDNAQVAFSLSVGYEYALPPTPDERTWEASLLTYVTEDLKLLNGALGKTRATIRSFSLDIALVFDSVEPPAEQEQVARPAGGNIRQQRILVCESLDSHAGVSDVIKAWGADTVREPRLSHLFYHLVAAVRDRRPFDSVVLCMLRQSPQVPNFAAMLHADSEFEDLNVVLLTPLTGDAQTPPSRMDGIDVQLPLPVEKPLLFNALHRTRTVAGRTTDDLSAGKITEIFSRYSPQHRRYEPLEILVGEREEVKYQVLRRILEQQGHKVYRVTRGDEALDAMTGHRFDVVLLNISLDGMDGIEVAKIYHLTHPAFSASRIILLAADSSTQTLEECHRAGVDRLLTLPISKEKVLAAIRETARPDPDTVQARANRTAVQPDDMSGDTGLIDPDTLRDLEVLGNGLPFLDELIEGFSKDSRQLLDAMGRASTRADYDEFRDLAHALKSSAGSVGASTLYDLARQASHVRDKEFANTAPLVLDELGDNLRRSQAALREHLRIRREQARET